MLRNRSRAVSGKQALMADHHQICQSSYTKPVPNSFFNSPRFKAFTPIIDHSLISPTSVLDSKSFFSLQNLFSFDPNSPKKPIFPRNKQKISGPKPIGLALIEDKHDSKPSKSVIFSAKLRVQIPPPPSLSPPSESGGGDGGIFYPCRIGDGLMTVEEMEVCEEYTCVRTHGPNAKITHIFYNFVVKSFVDCGFEKYSIEDVKNKKMKMKKKKNDFLSFCYTCKNNLELTNDIYIYRGEKAFCSHECRYQEMLLDEEEEDSS